MASAPQDLSEVYLLEKRKGEIEEVNILPNGKRRCVVAPGPRAAPPPRGRNPPRPKNNPPTPQGEHGRVAAVPRTLVNSSKRFVEHLNTTSDPNRRPHTLEIPQSIRLARYPDGPNEIVNSDTGRQPNGAALPCEGKWGCPAV